ncbi:MAG TPA: hypothetical protein VLA92_02635 [Candidatus Saccharimonadales bacterium]|nr:hypothetical protein [Candidatus Saccharimonadales bacterium]
MARLPVPGDDSGTWGTLLNDFLSVEHNTDGTHNVPTMERTTNKGQANGYVPLDGSSKIASSYLPAAIPQSQITNLTTDLAAKVAKGALVFDVRDYGALGDATRLRNVVATAGSASVTASGGAFTSGDVGKFAVVYTEDGAGTIRTIASVQSGTSITLSGAAGITVSGATGYLLFGTDDSAAIAAALVAATPTGTDVTVGPNHSMGLGQSRVLLPARSGDGGYIIASQLSIPSGVNLDAPGMIVNMLSDRYNPAILLNPYASAENLLLECMFGTGIQAGTGGANQAHIYMGNVRLWHIGQSSEVSGAFRKQDGIALVGYHFEIKNLFAKGGVRTVYHNPGTDTLVNYAYAIGSHTAVEVNGGNQIAYPQLFVDTCGKAGGGTNGVILDNEASNISMNIQAFEVNGTDHVLDSIVAVGAITAGINKDISLRIQANNTGGAMLLLTHAQELNAVLLGSNAPFPSGDTSPITTAVIYGAGNTGINSVHAMLETSITPYTGTLQGTYTYEQLDVTHFQNPITVNGVITATNTPSTDIYNGNAIATGEEVLPRLHSIGAQGLDAGSVHLTYFTARKTETINNIRMLTDATPATGTTLARMGIYSVDGGGNLALLAASANDVTIFDDAYSPYLKALTAPFAKVKGTRYAIGVLFTGTTPPTITGMTVSGADSSLPPRLCGLLAGQTDLPANITAGSVAEDYRLFQTTITP